MFLIKGYDQDSVADWVVLATFLQKKRRCFLDKIVVKLLKSHRECSRSFSAHWIFVITLESAQFYIKGSATQPQCPFMWAFPFFLYKFQKQQRKSITLFVYSFFRDEYTKRFGKGTGEPTSCPPWSILNLDQKCVNCLIEYNNFVLQFS